jgi:hypothetical protein
MASSEPVQPPLASRRLSLAWRTADVGSRQQDRRAGLGGAHMTHRADRGWASCRRHVGGHTAVSGFRAAPPSIPPTGRESEDAGVAERKAAQSSHAKRAADRITQLTHQPVGRSRGQPRRFPLGVVSVLSLTLNLRGVIGFYACGVLIYYAVASAAALTEPVDQRRWPRGLQALGRGGYPSPRGDLAWESVVVGPIMISAVQCGRWVVLGRQVARDLANAIEPRHSWPHDAPDQTRAAQSRSRPPARRITGRERGHSLLVHAVRRQRIGVS